MSLFVFLLYPVIQAIYVILSPAGIDLAFYPGDSFDVQKFSSGVVENFIPDVMGHEPKVAMITGRFIVQV